MLRIAAAFLAIALVSANPAETANSAAIAQPRSTEAWKKRHDANVARSKLGDIDIVFAGDSLTQRWETDGRESWVTFVKAANLGIGGDRTQHLLWRITLGQELAGLDPKAIVLLIGTNNIGTNTPAEIAAGVRAIVAELRKQKPKSQILVLGLLPRAGQPVDGDETAAPARSLQPKIGAVNKLLSKLEDDSHVEFLDLGGELLDPDGNLSSALMPDFLHLSPAGYRLCAESLKQPIADRVNGVPSPKQRAKRALRSVEEYRSRLTLGVKRTN